jgi:hypothetical protein
VEKKIIQRFSLIRWVSVFFNKKSLFAPVILLTALLFLPHHTEGADNFGVLGVRGLIFTGTTLETACQMVQDADIGWYRGEVLWKNIVDNEGNFNWVNLDGKIENMLRHEINIILTLRSVHKLFAPGSGKVDLGYKTIWKSAPPAPEYLENYKDFVRQIVERYDGDGVSDAPFINGIKNIKHWQIENEPGKKPNKGSNFWDGTAADYAALFLVAFDVIKEADAEAKVALSGFTHVAIKYYLEHNISFISEVLRIIHENGGDYDIFDYHCYTNYKGFIKTTKFTDKPVWVTETNVDKNQMDPNYTTEEYNRFIANDIVKRYSTMFFRGSEKVFWFEFSDKKDAIWTIPMEPNDFEQFRGLTLNDLTPKPIYFTYKLFITKVKDKERVKKVTIEPDLWVYKFGHNDRAVYVMWYDNPLGVSKGVNIPLPWESVLITHVITEPGVTEPYTEIKSTQDGFLHITLDNSPVFLEKH